MGRLALLLTTPRVAPGLMTYAGWQAVASASRLLAAGPEEPVAVAVGDAGFAVETAPADGPPDLARLLVEGAREAEVVWLGSADGDPGLTDAIASEVSRLEDPPEVEVVVGSWDVPGARLLDVVAVLDRLRSPGGCPWDAEQTHVSLAPYLLEEAHEAVEAIERGDRAHLAEELGDVLLQVVFHARVAEEAGEDGFDVDDVAGRLVEKLVRRHPHVFADVAAETAEDVERNWEHIKADERAAAAAAPPFATDRHETAAAPPPCATNRHEAADDAPPFATSRHEAAAGTPGGGLLDGIPASLPALLAAQKVLSRIERRGGDLAALSSTWTGSVGEELLAIVARARAEGVSAETELRATLRELTARPPAE
ncbi:MAG TPA: MazG family protein [Dermatophilaceae bacterium]|nr:MazG family protein [Dermatophilaceae bacterium]